MADIIDPAASNVEIMRVALAAMERGDLDACVAMLTDDFLIDVAGAPPKRGHRAWRDNAEALFASFSDVKLDIVDIFGAGDRVAVRLRVSGRHTGEFLGQQPTGKRIDYTSNELYQIRDGKIAAEWICSDTLALMTQTGVVSGARVIGLWLAGFRFWFALAIGVIAGAIAVWLLQSVF
jgi:predicted ester cyclase